MIEPLIVCPCGDERHGESQSCSCGKRPGRCLTCDRPLKDWRTCAPNDPAMDCGGDCLACMREFEDEPC